MVYIAINILYIARTEIPPTTAFCGHYHDQQVASCHTFCLVAFGILVPIFAIISSLRLFRYPEAVISQTIMSHIGVESNEQRAIQQIKVALDSIPASEKLGYLEAVDKAPRLFDSESHPLKLIQSSDYNVWEAAKRMVKYWEDRKNLFGDRAFLPMTQTGDGALSPDDTIVLQTGFPVLIPDHSGNGQVLFFDRRRALDSSSREAKLCCVLYFITVVSEDVRARLNKVFAMVLLITRRYLEVRDVQPTSNNTRFFGPSACCRLTGNE